MSVPEERAYTNLILEVIKNTGNKDVLESIKMNYANVIESKRALLKITTLEQLIRILELRDVINECDVSVLKDLFKCLSSMGNADEAVKEMYQLIIDYEKLHRPDAKQGVCVRCFAPTEAKPLEGSPVMVSQYANAAREECNGDINMNELRNAIQEIQDQLPGETWIKLGRKLGVPEHRLTLLKSEMYIKPFSETVHEMMQYWYQEHPEVTVDDLIDALEHKWVARKDLGLKLRRLCSKK